MLLPLHLNFAPVPDTSKGFAGSAGHSGNYAYGIPFSFQDIAWKQETKKRPDDATAILTLLALIYE